MGAPRHWIETDAGLVGDENRDAFVWLGPEDTHQQGWLWVVCDGHGPPRAAAFAAALVVTSFAELYPEALDRSVDIYDALDAVVDEVNRRILSTVDAYPDLRGMGASVACLAVNGGLAWIAHAGHTVVFAEHDGRLSRLTTDHDRADGIAMIDGDEADRLSRALGRSGVRLDRNGGRPVPTDDQVFLIVTDGVSRAVPEVQLAEAVERLEPREATSTLLELARRNWSDDNLTAAVVRFSPPPSAKLTSADAVLDWASGDVSEPDDAKRTLVLQPIRMDAAPPTPPRTNAEHLPSLPAMQAGAEAAAPVRRTQLFTPGELRAARSSAAVQGESTIVFSPQELDQVQARGREVSVRQRLRASAPPIPTPPSTDGSAATLAFSPQEMAEVRAPALPPSPDLAAESGPQVLQASGVRRAAVTFETAAPPTLTGASSALALALVALFGGGAFLAAIWFFFLRGA